MPDTRAHRGPHPQDEELFAEDRLGDLRSAMADLSWLLSRGYADASSLKLVGDRYSLTARQRTAVARCACRDEALRARGSRQLTEEQVRGREMLIDGFNVLTTVEAALAGGVVIVGRDGNYRDMASMHGSYRMVEESVPAAEIIFEELGVLGVASARWLFDKPVSNSGRLKQRLEAVAERGAVRNEFELAPDPDPMLAAARDKVVVSADSGVLDRCGEWFPLARWVVKKRVAGAWVVDLGTGIGAD